METDNFPQGCVQFPVAFLQGSWYCNHLRVVQYRRYPVLEFWEKRDGWNCVAGICLGRLRRYDLDYGLSFQNSKGRRKAIFYLEQRPSLA